MILLSQRSKEFDHAIAIAANISRRGWRLVSISQGDDAGQTWWFVFFEIPHNTSTKEVAEVVSGESAHVAHATARKDIMEPTPGPWRVGKNGSVVICDTDPTDGANTGHGGPSAIQYYGGCMIAESIWKRADARLMAASWKLLEACEATVKCWGPSAGQDGNQRKTLLLNEKAITEAKKGERP